MKLKYSLIGLATLAFLFLTYFVAKLAVWSNLVAAPYMVAHYETTRCNKFLAVKAEQELAKQTDSLKQMSSKGTIRAICYYDEKACDKADKMWEEYEANRAWYHKWFPL